MMSTDPLDARHSEHEVQPSWGVTSAQESTQSVLLHAPLVVGATCSDIMAKLDEVAKNIAGGQAHFISAVDSRFEFIDAMQRDLAVAVQEVSLKIIELRRHLVHDDTCAHADSSESFLAETTTERSTKDSQRSATPSHKAKSSGACRHEPRVGLKSCLSARTLGPTTNSSTISVRFQTSVVPHQSSVCASGAGSRGFDDSTSVGALVGPRAGWPGTIMMREELVLDNDLDRMIYSDYEQKKDSILCLSRSDIIGSGTELGGKSTLQRWWEFNCVMHPSSLTRAALDVCTFIVLTYDLVMVPIILAWSIELAEVKVLWVAALCSMAFWSLEMVTNFFTGFFVMGQIELRRARIAAHYMKTTFIIDLVVLVTDWLNLVVIPLLQGGQSSTGPDLEGASFLRLSKTARMLRMISVLRMSRLSKLIRKTVDDNFPVGTFIVFEVLKVLGVILWINHLVACMWFAIGDFGNSDTHLRWIDEAISPRTYTTYRETPSPYQYVSAYHWSLSQMTPGSMVVQPQCTLERIFNILCLILGFVFFSSLVSTVSSKLTQFGIVRHQVSDQLATLRRFLRQRKVCTGIAISVQRQVIERMNQRPPLSFCNVQALDSLGPALSSELRYELCKSQLQCHPLFRFWATLDLRGLQSFCFKALEFRLLPPGDVLFLEMDKAECMYIVASGTLTYTQSTSTRLVAEETISIVSGTQYLCEAALWSHWSHVGTAEVRSHSELFAISVIQLLGLMLQRSLVHRVLADYGQAFYRRLIQLGPPVSTWPNDLDSAGGPACECVCGAESAHLRTSGGSQREAHLDFGDIVCSMSLSARVVIGHTAVKFVCDQTSKVGFTLFRERSTNFKCYERLLDEMQAGKSAILPTGTCGEVERIVVISTIRLRLEDGRVLVVLGEWTAGGGVSVKFRLPGNKVDINGQVESVMQRTLTWTLAPFASNTSLETSEIEVGTSKSLRYGIRTKYIRRVQNASFDGDVKDLNLAWATHTPQRDKQPTVLSRFGHRISQLGRGKPRGGEGRMSTDLVGCRISWLSGVVQPEVFVLIDDETVLLCAWLTHEELQNEDDIAHQLLSGVSVDCDIVARANEVLEAAREELPSARKEGGCESEDVGAHL